MSSHTSRIAIARIDETGRITAHWLPLSPLEINDLDDTHVLLDGTLFPSDRDFVNFTRNSTRYRVKEDGTLGIAST